MTEAATPEDIAKKIVGNPNGYTEESVTVAAAYLGAVAELKRLREPVMSAEASEEMSAMQMGWRCGHRR